MYSSAGFTPHGPGFRFIDHFEMVDSKTLGRATFHLHPELSFFNDHFPGNPIMPAALLLECAAQAAGVLWMSVTESAADIPARPLFIAAIEQMRIYGPGLPGDTLTSTVELTREFGSLAQFKFETATARGVVAKGNLTLSRQLKASP